MKKCILLFCIYILTLLSCTKEDNKDEKTLQKPAGKYLSEIRTNASLSRPEESVRLAELEYNSDRFLKKIKFYIPETQQLSRYIEFFYNSEGMTDHMELHYSASNVMIDEKFTYENGLAVLKEGYKVEDFKSLLVTKTTYKVNLDNNTVEIYQWEKVGDQLVKRSDYEKNYFNVKGNLFRVHHNVGKGSSFETIEEFEYDTKNSPFSNLDISYYNIISPFFHAAECFSTNNVISHKTYSYDNGSGIETASDTIVYKYEGDYPVESAVYVKENNAEEKLKSVYFFKYADLK